MPVPVSLHAVLTDPDLPNPLIVGDAVRDWVLAIPRLDYEVECHECSAETLTSVLQRYGDLQPTDSSNAHKVVIAGATYLFSIPTSNGVELSERQAAARRMYSVNAMAYNPRTNELKDYFGGQKDLRDGILRHTTDYAFASDRLAPLRTFQLASRLNLEVSPETLSLCREMRHSHSVLNSAQIAEQWVQWSEHSERPSIGLSFLRDTKILSHYPSLARLVTVTDPDIPDTNLFEQAALRCDALSDSPEWQSRPPGERAAIMFAALVQDIAQPDSKVFMDERGESHAWDFLAKEVYQTDSKVIERSCRLVRYHDTHLSDPTADQIIDLSRQLEPSSFEDLELLIRADAGCPSSDSKVISEQAQTMLDHAKALGVYHGRPEPLLNAEDLLDSGMQPGPEIETVLAHAYKLQTAGRFQTRLDAQIWLELRNHDLPEAQLNSAELETAFPSPGPHIEGS